MKTEISRRRTLAIISHPDAGKTTLTEKLLLYGGAVDQAGSVTAKKNQRDTASDWMEMEKQRGISISSTVLQFEYRAHRLNLLDTPGHEDFSEDTFRVLTAVDSAIMVLDAAKGVESRTVRLFEVCRKRRIPVTTFVNKLDRPSKSPLELMDHIELILGLKAVPVNWPVKSGASFLGVYDRLKKEAYLFDKTAGGTRVAGCRVLAAGEAAFREELGESAHAVFMEELELLDHVYGRPDMDRVRAGDLSPVFFGSAVNNFGVGQLLEGLLEYASPPLPRLTADGVSTPPESPLFSAFVFKIQTNMNPRHRDRMVFARVCSGKFERDIRVFNTRTKSPVRISCVHSLFGREREAADEAFPGDIIGFVTNDRFKAGDTVSQDPQLAFEKIPRFAPEIFAYVNAVTTDKYKSFRKGLEHLTAEDIVQTFRLDEYAKSVPLLGAMGRLQFEVLQDRLRREYGVETNLEIMPWTILRWVTTPVDGDVLKSKLSYNGVTGTDDGLTRVVLFKNQWELDRFTGTHPEITLEDVAADKQRDDG